MNRAGDISQKLSYALECANSLFDDMTKAHSSDAAVKFLGEKAGQVLSTCRECFDYTARDLYEQYVLTSCHDPKLARAYARGKQRVYFPFRAEQIDEEKQPFAKLRVPHPRLFKELKQFVAGISKDEVLPGTCLRYRMFTEMNSMVNQKKHDRIIESFQRDHATTIISGTGTAVGVHPIGTPQGPNPGDLAIAMHGPSTVQVNYAKDYFFEANGERVHRFGMFLINGTSIFLRGIYKDFFGVHSEYLDPWSQSRAGTGLTERM